jgi:nicotinamidase-related amidase
MGRALVVVDFQNDFTPGGSEREPAEIRAAGGVVV